MATFQDFNFCHQRVRHDVHSMGIQPLHEKRQINKSFGTSFHGRVHFSRELDLVDTDGSECPDDKNTLMCRWNLWCVWQAYKWSILYWVFNEWKFPQSPSNLYRRKRFPHPYRLNYPNFDHYIEIVQCSSYGIASLWYIHPKGWPTLPSLQYFLILFKRGGGWGVGVTPMFKKNFRIRNSVKNALVKA